MSDTDSTMLGLIPNGGVLDVETGEVYPSLAETPTPVLVRIAGRVQLEIDRTMDALRSAKGALGAELIDRMDKSAEWTLHAPGVKVTAPSPSAGTEGWDAELLDEILDGLVADGVITQEAKLRAVEQVVQLKISKRGVASLLKVEGARDRMLQARRVGEPPARRAVIEVDPRQM